MSLIPEGFYKYLTYALCTNLWFQFAVTVVYRHISYQEQMTEIRSMATASSLLWPLTFPLSLVVISVWLPFALFTYKW